MSNTTKQGVYTPEAVLHCTALTHGYHDGEQMRLILDNVHFAVPAGAHIAIVGASGSGKSTLLQLLGGLTLPLAGEVYWQGQPISAWSVSMLSQQRNTHLGFVYQRHHLLSAFSVLENVCMPLRLRGLSFKQARDAALPLLAAVELDGYVRYQVSQLSGGQKQRVALARALVTRPACVLADEPTGNLDQRAAERVYQLHTRLTHAYRTSFVIVTHDMHLARRMDAVWTLSNGQLSLN